MENFDILVEKVRMFFVLSKHNELVFSCKEPNDKKNNKNVEYVNHDSIIMEFYIEKENHPTTLIDSGVFNYYNVNRLVDSYDCFNVLIILLTPIFTIFPRWGRRTISCFVNDVRDSIINVIKVSIISFEPRL